MIFLSFVFHPPQKTHNVMVTSTTSLHNFHGHLGRHLFGQVRPQESAANVHDILGSSGWEGGRFDCDRNGQTTPIPKKSRG